MYLLIQVSEFKHHQDKSRWNSVSLSPAIITSCVRWAMKSDSAQSSVLSPDQLRAESEQWAMPLTVKRDIWAPPGQPRPALTHSQRPIHGQPPPMLGQLAR